MDQTKILQLKAENNPLTEIAQNKKHDEKMIYRPRVLRGVISMKIIHRGEITGGNRDGNEFRGVLTPGRRGQGWAHAPCV
jgi:hypothetical protein